MYVQMYQLSWNKIVSFIVSLVRGVHVVQCGYSPKLQYSSSSSSNTIIINFRLIPWGKV